MADALLQLRSFAIFLVSLLMTNSLPVNLAIQPDHWMYMPGASPTAQGVKVTFAGNTISTQNGAKHTQSFPINWYGSYLHVEKDFKVTTRLTNIKDSATFLLYGDSNTFDEFRVDSGLSLTLDKDALTLLAWDGKHTSPVLNTRHLFSKLNIPSKDEYELVIARAGSNITLNIDSVQVTQFPDIGYFKKNNIWFGATTTPLGSFTLQSLFAAPLNGGVVNVLNSQNDTLVASDPNAWQSLAKKNYPNKKIGAAVSLGPLVSDSAYYSLATTWYGVWTIENDLKAQAVHPQKDVYTFGPADAILKIAEKHNIAVHGHALVFGEANPEWMQKTPPAQLQQIMIDHVKTVVGHYKGKINSWDVINEPLNADGGGALRSHIWYKAFAGKDYMRKALEAAHETDPNATLCINEWGLEEDGDRWDEFLKLIQDLKLKLPNIPLCVGFQAHIDEKRDRVNPTVLSEHFKLLADLDVQVRISELDVAPTSIQSSQYTSILKTCLDAPNCKDFSMWGISEDHGTGTELIPGVGLEFYEGLPFDSQKKPRPVVAAIQKILSN